MLARGDLHGDGGESGGNHLEEAVSPRSGLKSRTPGARSKWHAKLKRFPNIS